MNELDEAERRAIEAIERLREEYFRACEPYVKIIMDIRAVRPQVYYIDGSMLIPFSTSTAPPQEAKHD